MDKCPHCGSMMGVYRTYTGVQYYDWNGEPAGFQEDPNEAQSVFVRCISCNRKISMRRILKGGAEV